MKTIHIDLLDSQSIKSAIADLREVKKDWKKKANEAAQEVCREIAMQIQANLKYIPYTDDMVNVATHEIIQKKDTLGVWDMRETKNGCMVSITGKDIVFVEFGAGISHNGSGGQNPLAVNVHFDTAIGSYGKGQGANNYWFVAHNLISRGTPAYMPIYRAILAVKPEIPTIVRKVFV